MLTASEVLTASRYGSLKAKIDTMDMTKNGTMNDVTANPVTYRMFFEKMSEEASTPIWRIMKKRARVLIVDRLEEGIIMPDTAGPSSIPARMAPTISGRERKS
ncbi:MAG: hypothetical protein AMDU3_IPLC00002G0122 [Thermoplasmatales archaeon I-plasma]|nr:MAG: hypothetical protein AMDU3_IPLC00002G0122 [Thermoplasmatales archaeon I-plasma]